MKTVRVVAMAAGLMCGTRLPAAEWQWSVRIDAAGAAPAEPVRAFLWIPENCAEVRGVVVGQSNMLEEGILERASFRRTLRELRFAEVWIAPKLDPVFDFTRGTGERFVGMMRALARNSGYGELADAPVVPIGHSACASYPWNLAAWNPGRTLAVLSIKGDAPQTDLTGSGRPNPDWGERTIDGIPGLMVMSESEWWEARLTPLLRFRAAHAAAPIAMLADAGHSHFDASDELVEYLALFIRKAAAARLPRHAGDPLRNVDPAQGWLIDRWRGDGAPRAAAARFADFKGDRAEALWCFDAETARATEAYQARMRGKQSQQVDFVQHGVLAPLSTSHAGVELKFEPGDDGVTFQLGAEFIAPLPPKPPLAAKDKPPPPSVITPIPAASGMHAAGEVRIERITGPVAQLGAQTFRVALNRASALGGPFGGDIWLYAWHPGDAHYKSAVQQAVLKLPQTRVGAEQTITFDPVADQQVGVTSLSLRATSSAGSAAKVYFYVREGPAEVDGDTLRFTGIPPRAKLPLSVTVIAWQLGRATEPKLKAAAPVERTFLIR